MPIEDLNQWANNLEVVRIPAIENDIVGLVHTTQGLLVDVSNLTQETGDTFDEHDARITTSQLTADEARDLANQSLSRLISNLLEAQTNLQNEAQTIRDELNGRVDGIQASVSIGGSAYEDIIAQIGDFRAEAEAIANQARAFSESMRDSVLQEMADVLAISDEILNEHLPLQGGSINALVNQTNALKGEVDEVLAGFEYETLMEGLDDMRDRLSNALIPIGVTSLSLPAADWIVDSASAVFAPKTAAADGIFLAGNSAMADHVHLGSGSPNTIGQAAPVEFFPGRVYQVRAKISSAGTTNKVGIGISTWGESGASEQKVLKIVADPLTDEDGVMEVTAVFSTNLEKLEEVGYSLGTEEENEAVHLVGSGAANKAFFFVESNVGGETSGALKVLSIAVRDISSALDPMTLVRDKIERELESTRASIEHLSGLIVDLDETVAFNQLTLNNQFGDLSANLTNNYYTKTATDSAIAGAVTSLESQLNDTNGVVLGQGTALNNLTTRVEDVEDELVATAVNQSLLTAQVNGLGKSIFPTDFKNNGAHFVIGEPSGFDPDPIANSFFRSVAGIGTVFFANDYRVLGPMGLVPAIPGQTIYFEARIRATQNSTVTGDTKERAFLGLRGYDANGSPTGSYYNIIPGDAQIVQKDPLRVVDGWVVLSGRYTFPEASTQPYVRPRLYMNSSTGAKGNAVWEVSHLIVRDETAVKAAEASAFAASGYAQTAIAKAGEAEDHASAASGHVDTAATRAGEAQSAATSAANSKTDAENAATSASNSATLSATAKDQAVASTAELFPSTFKDGGTYFVTSEPSGFEPPSAAESFFRVVPGVGKVFFNAGLRTLSPRAMVPATPGRAYYVEVRARVTVNSTTTGGTRERLYLGFRGYDGEGIPQGAYYNIEPYRDSETVKDPLRVADGWQTVAGVYSVPPGGIGQPYIRPRVYLGYNAGGNGDAEWEVATYVVKDVTEALVAESEASAAASSAFIAETQAGLAGTSATAAAASATSAATQAGNAATSAMQASVSETNALGSSNSALSSASVAASSLSAAQQAINTAKVIIPGIPGAELDNYGPNSQGTVQSFSSLSSNSYGSDSDGPWVQRNLTSTGVAAYLRGLAPVSPQAAYKVTIRFLVTEAKTLDMRAAFVGLSGAAYKWINIASDTYAANVLHTVSFVAGLDPGGLVTDAIGASGDWDPSATLGIRFGIRTADSPGGILYTYEVRVENYTEADQAARQAGIASTKAGEASVSATNAATSATNALGSANSASASSVVAVSTKDVLINTLHLAPLLLSAKPIPELLMFGPAGAGTAEEYDATAATGSEYGSDGDGLYYERATNMVRSAYIRPLLRLTPDSVFRVTIRVKSTTDSIDFSFRAAMLTDGVSGWFPNSPHTNLTPGTIHTLTWVIGANAGGLVDTVLSTGGWASANGIRFGCRNVSTGAGSIRIYSIEVQDVTQADLAERARATASLAAVNASVSSVEAAESATSAAGSSASALAYRDAAARMSSGGVSKNPVFNDWDGPTPANVSFYTGGSSYVTKATNGVRYVNAVELVGSDTNWNRPIVRLDTVNNSLDCVPCPDQVLITAELELISGTLNGGAHIMALWTSSSGGTVAFEVRLLNEFMTSETGRIQTISWYVEKPTSFVAGTTPRFYVEVCPVSTYRGATRQPCTLRVHRLDFEVITANSQSEILQRAKVDLEGIQSAVTAFRSKAGSAGAELELVALDDPQGGSTSTARIAAKNIILEGSVSMTELTVAPNNMILNPGFRKGTRTDWRGWSFTAYQSVVAQNAAGVPANAPSSYVMKFAHPTTSSSIAVFNGSAVQGDAGADMSAVPVVPGGKYRMSVMAAASNPGAVNLLRLRVYWRLSNGSYSSWSSAVETGSIAAGWNKYSGVVTAPDNAVSCQAYLLTSNVNGTAVDVYWCSMAMRQMADADLLVEGSITAESGIIADLAVDTLQLAGNAVTIPVYSEANAEVRPVASPGTVVGTAAIMRAGYRTRISFGCQMGGPGYSEVRFEVKRNGAFMRAIESGTGPNGASQSVFFQFEDTDLGTGATTYTVHAIWKGYAQAFITQRVLSLQQTKR